MRILETSELKTYQNDKDIGKIYKKKFISYISSLPVSNTHKALLADDKFINENPIFYIYYPKLFSSAFKGLDKQKVDLLCIAGYLYYQSTLFLDSVIDDGNKRGIFMALVCQEEATKLMTHIFDLDTDYWILWNQRKQEYLNAIQIEKEYLKSDGKITLDQYSKLADFKSSFGKAAIDSIFKLSENNENEIYIKLINSHKYFSAAFQLNDDVLDFQEDFRKKQFNWAIYSMQNTKIENFSISELNKLFYIRGYAKKLFQKAIEYINMALNEVQNISVPIWIDELEKLRNKFIVSILEIDNYLELLNIEIKISNEFVTENSTSLSIRNAIKFIKSSQNKDGSWREYVNQGGISDTWSTAYITSKLSGFNSNNEFENNIKKAIKFLQNSKRGMLWGYNQTWITDSDTTNFVLLAFHYNSIFIDDSVFENWIRFYDSSQGFSTYIDSEDLLKSLKDKNITNVNSWTSGHQCVSAVSFFFMTVSKKFQKEHSTLNKLFDNFLGDDKIESYWWTSNIYTLYYLVKSYKLLNNTKNVKLILEKIGRIQNADGSFSDKYGTNFFMTGMAIEIMLIHPEFYQNQISKGIKFLLENQYSDGSWANSNSLQIPDPKSKDDVFYPVETHGTSVRAKEFNRLFTTVSILETLLCYEKTIASSRVV